MHALFALQLVALTNATVIDPAHGTAVRDLTIVVRGRRIEAVGPVATTPVPAGTRLVNVRGRFIIPGLWDMHVHNDVPGGRALLPLYIAHGVTGVRDMNGALGNCDSGKVRSWQGIWSAQDGQSGPYLVGARVPLPHILTRTASDAVSASIH